MSDPEPTVAASASAHAGAGESAGAGITGAVPDAAPSTFDSTSFLRDIPMPLDEPVPTRVGGYRIVRVLGRGGMGVVYEAEQEATRRFVAIKLIHPHLTTPRYRRRFAEEIRTLGRFEHPGIARIHDAGAAPDDQGALRIFFAMELVVGLRIDEHVAGAALEPRAIAALMATVCEAVHHAHQKGVIHCDLTPANIVVGADGTAKVLDFGIARMLDDDIRETTLGTDGGAHAGVLGTLAYASPEQAAGDRNRLDVLTDVYGLGAVLYALLTGQPPHLVRGCGLAEAVRLVQSVPPARLRTVSRALPQDLETIVDKALAPAPKRRYDSAAALAVDLRNFVERRPIAARAVPWHEIAIKWVHRNRLVAALLTLATLATLAVAVIAVVAAVQINSASVREQSERNRRDAFRNVIEGSQIPTASRMQRAAVFMADLRDAEAPEYPGRWLVLQDWVAGSAPGKTGSGLHSFDAEGVIVDPLDGPRAWPSWAQPRFDGAALFEHGIEGPHRARTLVAALIDRGGASARELVRGIRLDDDHIHMAVLEIAEVEAVARSRGAVARGTRQWWSRGDFRDLVWDPSRQLLWVLSSAEEFAGLVPELAAWDSARCPNGSDDPRLLFAFDPTSASGVIPPLTGDAQHPPVRAAWAFTTLPPSMVREPIAAASASSGDAPLGSDRTGALRLYIQSFRPYAQSEGKGLGLLYVLFRHAMHDRDIIASVELDDRGAPVGAFTLEPSASREDNNLAQQIISQSDPAREIIAIDLVAIMATRSIAEQLLRNNGALGEALVAAAMLPSDVRQEVARRVTGMTSSWTWLKSSAAEILEQSTTLAALGDPEHSDHGQALIALARIDLAIELHRDRCPAHGDGSCIYEWFLESERALALAAAGDWPACVASATRAVELRQAHASLGGTNPIDHAILAIAHHAMDHDEAAHRELKLAEEALEGPRASGSTNHGSARIVAPQLLARARALLRGE